MSIVRRSPSETPVERVMQRYERSGSAEHSFDCPHGLDMRLHPRCFICAPIPAFTAPFTTPAETCDCPTIWFGIVRPPCRVHNPTVCVCKAYGSHTICPAHNPMSIVAEFKL